MLERRTKNERLRRVMYLYARNLAKSYKYLWIHSHDSAAHAKHSKLQESYFDRALKAHAKFLEMTRAPYRKPKWAQGKFEPNENTPPIRYIPSEKIVEMLTR